MKLTTPTRAQLDTFAALMYEDMLSGIAWEARAVRAYDREDERLAEVSGLLKIEPIWPEES